MKTKKLFCTFLQLIFFGLAVSMKKRQACNNLSAYIQQDQISFPDWLKVCSKMKT